MQVGPRLGRGSDIHADTLIRLMGWLGQTDLKPYISTETEETDANRAH